MNKQLYLSLKMASPTTTHVGMSAKQRFDWLALNCSFAYILRGVTLRTGEILKTSFNNNEAFCF